MAMNQTMADVATNVLNGAPSKIDHVAREASKMVEDARESAHALVEEGNQAVRSGTANAGQVLNKAKAQVDTAVDATRQAAKRASAALGDYAAQCEDYVSREPIKAVTIAAATGAALAAVMLVAMNRRR